MRDSTLVSANETSAMPSAPTASWPRSPASTVGHGERRQPAAAPRRRPTRRAGQPGRTPPTTTVAPTTHTSTPGHARRPPLAGEDHRDPGERRWRARSGWSRRRRRPRTKARGAVDHALGVDREPEQLRQLADDHDERDPVHVAVADRLGQEVGDEAEAGQAGDDADRAGEDRRACRRARSPRPGRRRPAGRSRRRSAAPARSQVRARGSGSARRWRTRRAGRSSRRAR